MLRIVYAHISDLVLVDEAYLRTDFKGWIAKFIYHMYMMVHKNVSLLKSNNCEQFRGLRHFFVMNSTNIL